MTQALKESHTDEKQCHEEAVTRLQGQYNQLQNRIDMAYEDKLDGRIDVAYFDRKSHEWRAEQDRLLKAIQQHQDANQTYLEEGVTLLELAHRAHELFAKQEPREKRRLLDTRAVKRRADLARKFNLSRARVTQLLDLHKLHPDILEFVRGLSGAGPRYLSVRTLLLICPLPTSSSSQD